MYVCAGTESDIHLATLETQSQDKNKHKMRQEVVPEEPAREQEKNHSLGVTSYTYASSSKILSKKWNQEELFGTIESLKIEDL